MSGIKLLGTEIELWQHPSQDKDGDLYHDVSSAIKPDNVDQEKRWEVVGKTHGTYGNHGTWHWLQEVIDPTSTAVLKTVSSSTLKDNLIDLQSMQKQLKDLAGHRSTSSTEVSDLTQRIEAMEREIESLKSHFSSTGNLILKQKTDSHTPSIIYQDMQGKDTHYIFVRGDKLNMAVSNGDSNLGQHLSVSPRAVTVNDHTVEEIINNKLQYRTGVFGAELKWRATPYVLWKEIIPGTEIVSWRYPCEDSSGYKHSGSKALLSDDESKAKSWRIFGISTWEHHGDTTYWIQEVING